MTYWISLACFTFAHEVGLKFWHMGFCGSDNAIGFVLNFVHWWKKFPSYYLRYTGQKNEVVGNVANSEYIDPGYVPNPDPAWSAFDFDFVPNSFI